MSTFVQKSEATQQTVSAKAPVPGWANFGQSPEVNWILHLQQTIGNQAVQRLLETTATPVPSVQAKLTIGPPNFGARQE
jgi:hypothetical protein